MRKDIEKYERIEKYLNGQLSGKELNDFERQLKSDPELASELEKHKNISHLIHEGTLLRIRETVKEIHNTSYPRSLFRRGNSKFILITLVGTFIIVPFFFIKKIRIALENQQLPENVIPKIDTITRQVLNVDTFKEITHEEKIRDVIKSEKSYKKSTDHPVAKDSEITASEKILKEKEISMDVAVKIPDAETRKAEPATDDIKKKSEPANDTENTNGSDNVDCSTVLISAEVEIKESCEQKPTGTIQIIESTIQGGTPPYLVSIDDGDNFYPYLVFNELSRGNYMLWLKDRNNCLTKSGSYWVSSYDCSYEYVFAPEKGERWKAPNNGITGQLKIYNRQGNMVFSERIETAGNYFWEGSSSSNDPLPMGIYQFLLELDNNEKIIGNITIVR